MSASELKLDNVFWIGGSPCSGKSSISELLASRFCLDLYHVDDDFDVHVQHLDPTLHPALMQWHKSSWNQRWMQPVDKLVQDVIACYQEHFSLILADIASKSRRKALLVEGSALLPREVARVLPARTHAVWVIPTTSFQSENYSRREWVQEILSQCDEPEAAFHNWMARDAKFASWIKAEVRTLGLELEEINGKRPIKQTTNILAEHFQLSVPEGAG